MINSSYNIVLERLRAFAEGHFYIKSFSHELLNSIDLSTRIDYPIMQVIPGTITPSPKQLSYSFDIVFTDLARRKTDLELNTQEVISDMTRIALDLIFEITNGQVLFGRGVTVSEGSTITSFIDGFENTITGVTLSITINVPDQWNACIIPADWATGGTGYPSEGMRITSIPVLDEGNFVVNAYELDFRGSGVTVTREGNVARVTITGGGGGGGITCEDLPECEVIIDINEAIDTLETSLTALTSTVSTLSATVGGIQNDITEIESDITTLTSGLNSVNNAIDTIETEQTTQNNNITALQSLTIAQGEAIEDVQSDIAAIQTEQTSQNASISQLVSDVASLDGRVDTAETNISSLDSRVTTAEADITDTNNKLLKRVITTDSASVTTLTTETIVRSVLIPAGTVKTGEVWRLNSRLKWTGNGTVKTQRLRVNTTASIVGSTLVATNQNTASTQLYQEMRRHVVVKNQSSDTEVVPPTISLPNDNVNSAGSITSLNINWTVDQYIIVTAQTNNSADTAISGMFTFESNVNSF